MKKKFLITLGATLSLLALASCGSNTDNGKKLESTIVKDTFGTTIDNRSFKQVLTTTEGGDYEYLSKGYYITATANGNVFVKCLEDDNYSVDLGFKVSDVLGMDSDNEIFEVVKKSGDLYNHIFYSYKGEKLTEKTTNFENDFDYTSLSFYRGEDLATALYTKNVFSYEYNDVVTKVDIYEKALESINGDTTYEFKLEPFDTTEVVQDASKIGDYYGKSYYDNNNVVYEFYDNEGKLDDKILFEDGVYFENGYRLNDYVSIKQRSIPVSKFDDYDYYYKGVYYKLQSVMLDFMKHKIKDVKLNYVVGQELAEFDGEYTAITYKNIIDRKLEYTSIGFVDDSYDIEYSLPNESSLTKVKGGYYSSTNKRLYNENFEIVKEFSNANVSVSSNKTYLIVSYSDYLVIVNTANGEIIEEGKTDNLKYNDYMIQKTTDGITKVYDVVDGKLVERYSSKDAATTSITGVNYYYMVKSYDITEPLIDTYKIYAYGSSTPMTLYGKHSQGVNLNNIHSNDDYLYYSVSGLYTDKETKNKLRLCKLESYEKNNYMV